MHYQNIKIDFNSMVHQQIFRKDKKDHSEVIKYQTT